MSQFNDDSVMPFGKFKGWDIGRVPANYLLWLHGKLTEKRSLSILDKELLMYINSRKGLLLREASGDKTLRNNT